jgi:hypothetical protein
MKNLNLNLNLSTQEASVADFFTVTPRNLPGAAAILQQVDKLNLPLRFPFRALNRKYLVIFAGASSLLC